MLSIFAPRRRPRLRRSQPLPPKGSPLLPSFQIVVVLYNSANWIGPCLDAIRRLEYPNFEAWVVDNGSRDDGAEYVAQSYPRTRLLRSSYNRGFAGANNWGASQGPETDFIFFLNPDTEIHPDCLSHLAMGFALNPNLGIAGCKLLGTGGKIIQHVGGELRPNALAYHVGEGEKDQGQYTGLRPCTYAEGAALAIRRSLWNALGGFDDGFFPAYFEETDLCARARKAGWEIAVVCEAVVIHHQDPATQVRSSAFLELFFRGRARYLIRQYSPWEWLTRYLPAEVRWLISTESKGYRRLALRTLWAAWTGTPTE